MDPTVPTFWTVWGASQVISHLSTHTYLLILVFSGLMEAEK
jgi:hypothetical protein